MSVDPRALHTALAAMRQPVRVQFFTQGSDCDTCLPARQVLDQLQAHNEHLAIDEHNFLLDAAIVAAYRIERVPALAIVGTADSGIRFYGAPLGYEMASLVDAILMVSRGDSGLTDESRARLAEIDRPVHIRVFVTPNCVHCPKAARLACRMAVESPHVTAEVVEATGFPDLVQRYRISGVPKTVVNDRVEILGSVPEDMFVRQALECLSGQW